MEKDRNSQEYEDFVLLTKGAEAQLVEKKSRFIATVRPVESEEEAAAFIEEMKKKYYDARHNCSAFVIGSNAQLTRSSDDGEPSGTAGRPMLEVLLGSGIRNAAAVVTRYFGGTLLGTGGLVRAYSGVLKQALEQCETARQHYGVRIKIKADYNAVGKIQYLLASRNILTSIRYSVISAFCQLFSHGIWICSIAPYIISYFHFWLYVLSCIDFAASHFYF